MAHGAPLTTEGILLNRQQTGEKFLHLTFLSPESGLFRAGRRISASTTATRPHPDLFDEAALTLDPPRQGADALRFIREYRLLRRHGELGRSYTALTLACRYARVLIENPIPETSAPHLHAALRQALHAWETGRSAEAVYFKTLFLFARDEGFPVKEEWIAALPARDRDAVRELLHRPANESGLTRAEIHRLTARFEKYLGREHDLRFPEAGYPGADAG